MAGILGTAIDRGFRATGYSPLDDRYYQPIGASAANPAGVSVTADSVLTHSAAWACSRVIASTVASLPVITYQRTGGGNKQRAVNHPIYDLLHDEPNPDMDALTYFETGTLNCLNRGMAYSRIIPGARGFVDQIEPIHPDMIRQDPPIGKPRRYLVRDPQSAVEKPVNIEDVFKVPGMSVDGYTGLSVITYARRTMGLAIALEEYGARYFGSGARPGIVLQAKGTLTPEAARRLKADWESMHGGLQNAHRTAVLEEGMTAQVLTFSPEDSQFLGSRGFSIEDVARWYGVPLHMIGHTSKETSWGSGIEQMSLGFLTFTLLPWLRRWELAIKRQLILGPQFYCEFLVDAILRGDALTRAQSLQIQLRNGVLSPDEWRGMEGRNQIPDQRGDEFYMSVGMVPLGTETVEMQPTANQVSGTPGALADLSPYVTDAAARVLRKESMAMERAAKRAGDDPDAWEQAVQTFYRDHGPFVAESLRISAEMADAYIEMQRAALIRIGPALLSDGFEDAGTEYLSSMALGAARERVDTAGDSSELREAALALREAARVFAVGQPMTTKTVTRQPDGGLVITEQRGG